MEATGKPAGWFEYQLDPFSRIVEMAAQLEAMMLQLNYDNRFEESLAVGREYLAHLQAHGGRPAEVIVAYGALGKNLFKLERYPESVSMRRAEGDFWTPISARSPWKSTAACTCDR